MAEWISLTPWSLCLDDVCQQSQDHIVHVVSRFRACLIERQIQMMALFYSIFYLDLSVGVQILLVAYHVHHWVVLVFLINVFQPFTNVRERVVAGDIIDDQNAMHISVDRLDQFSLELVPCCVQEMDAKSVAVDENIRNLDVTAVRVEIMLRKVIMHVTPDQRSLPHLLVAHHSHLDHFRPGHLLQYRGTRGRLSSDRTF